MRSDTAIDTSIAIRADGSATVVEYDEDGACSVVDIENPEGIDMRAVVAQYMAGTLAVPQNVRKLVVRRTDALELRESGKSADVVPLMGRNAS